MIGRTDTIVILAIVYNAILAAAIAAGPAALGIPEVALKWGALLNVGLIAAANQIDALGSGAKPTPPVVPVLDSPIGPTQAPVPDPTPPPSAVDPPVSGA